MKIVNSSIIYDDPLPQLRSKHSYFPFLCERKDGVIAAVHVTGEAFESVDGTSCISFSRDGGNTWSDNTVCMEFDGNITCYEQRMCVLESGAIVCIGWKENVVTGERLDNHYTIFYDGEKTLSKPVSTGIRAQASSVCAIGGEKLLALHAVRHDTDRPGIYGCIVDLAEGKWNIIEQTVLWEPATPMTKDTKMAEIFSFLKFGQPGAIKLADGDIMMSHWSAENGQYKNVASRIKL